MIGVAELSVAPAGDATAGDATAGDATAGDATTGEAVPEKPGGETLWGAEGEAESIGGLISSDLGGIDEGAGAGA